MKKTIIFAGVIIAVLFAGCIPFEGNLDEVREKANGGGKRYTVTFESDGGSAVKDQKVKEGGTVKKPQDPTKSGWFFVNWFSDQTLETKYNFNAPVTSDITLYADWVLIGTERYEVTFNSKEGSYVEPQFVYREKKAYPPDDPVKRGHEFGGWYTIDGDPPTNVYNFSELITGEKTLYAKWDKITDVPGANLAEKFAWLKDNALSGTTYTVQANANEPPLAPQTLTYSGYTPVTIKLRAGLSGIPITNYSVSLSGNGSMFTIGSGVTMILENYLTLKGHSSNNAALVRVDYGGELTMQNNATINGNSGSGSGGGVYVGGVFTMNGGTIAGNNANFGGTAPVRFSRGGGVYVGGVFTMNGGTISGNTSEQHGGGVYVVSGSGVFTMKGGTISSNIARSQGGGVYVANVSPTIYGTFTKDAGTAVIYGKEASNGNLVMNSSGTVIDNSGHAVYVQGALPAGIAKRRETTADSFASLDSRVAGEPGGWEN